MDKLENLIKESFEFQNRQMAKNAEQDKKIKSVEDSILGLLPQDTNKLWQAITELQQKIQVIDYNINYKLKEKAVEAEPKKKFWDWFKSD